MSNGGLAARWYRRRIGDPVTGDEVYGYWLFALGTVAGVVGVAVFVYGSLAYRPPAYWQFREVGAVVAALGFLALLFGGLLRLPLGRVATALGGAGALVALVAVGWFVAVYPRGWFVPGEATPVVALYVVGTALVALAASVVPFVTPGPSTETAAGRVERAAADTYYAVYEDDGWRWRLYDADGQVLARSGRTYDTEASARESVDRMARNAPDAGVEFDDAAGTTDVSDDAANGDAGGGEPS